MASAGVLETTLWQTAGFAASANSTVFGDASKTWTCDRVPAYYSNKNRSKGLHQVKPSPSEVHWSRRPAHASAVHAPVAFQHQALVTKQNPHPAEGAQGRWPDSGFAYGSGTTEPLDDRKHDQWFGYCQQRWKRRTEEEPAPELTLLEIKNCLTWNFGSLCTAFKCLDFFEAGSISMTEFQMGLYEVFSELEGERNSRYRIACKPRSAFNQRMADMFRSMDTNNDGYVSFDDFCNSQNEAVYPGREFTQRRMLEEVDHKGEIARERFKRKGKEFVRSEEDPSVENIFKERVFKGDPDVDDAYEAVRRFAICLHEKFPNARSAFDYFDPMNGNEVSMHEFQDRFIALHFGPYVGDPSLIFETLADGKETLSFYRFCNMKKYIRTPAPEYDLLEPASGNTISSIPKKDITSKRQKRSPIQRPSAFGRGTCLHGTHLSHPLGEHVGSSAGFYKFARTTTGRLDLLLHPNDLPGNDSFNYRAECGPGYVEKGPEFFPESACHAHPVRGNKFKLGATMSKQPKLKALIPSRATAEVQACRDAAYCTHEGSTHTTDVWKLNGKGAVQNKGARYSATFGTADSFGLMEPRPVGFWGGSRMANSLLSQSAPNLLHTKC
jgi:Ca2+-binding EF-hand superfamily protein